MHSSRQSNGGAEERHKAKQSAAFPRSVGRSLAFLSISPSERETDDPSDDQGRTKTTEPPSPRTKAIQESEASFYECTKVEGEPKEEKRRRKESICCRFQFVHRRLLLRTRREREREGESRVKLFAEKRLWARTKERTKRRCPFVPCGECDSVW